MSPEDRDSAVYSSTILQPADSNSSHEHIPPDGTTNTFNPDGPPIFKRRSSFRMLNNNNNKIEFLTEQFQMFVKVDADPIKSYHDRLKSFQNNWPIWAQVDYRKIALYGMRYIGIEDKVQCDFCKGTLYSWSFDDCPLAEHRKHFDGCLFLKGESWKEVERYQADQNRASQNLDNELTLRASQTQDYGLTLPMSGLVNDSNLTYHIQETENQGLNPPMNDRVNYNKDNSEASGRSLDRVIQIISEMGYKSDIIEKAIEIASKTVYRERIDTQILLDVIFDIESGESKSDNDDDDDVIVGVCGSQTVYPGLTDSSQNVTQIANNNKSSLFDDSHIMCGNGNTQQLHGNRFYDDNDMTISLIADQKMEDNKVEWKRQSMNDQPSNFNNFDRKMPGNYRNSVVGDETFTGNQAGDKRRESFLLSRINNLKDDLRTERNGINGTVGNMHLEQNRKTLKVTKTSQNNVSAQNITETSDLIGATAMNTRDIPFEIQAEKSKETTVEANTKEDKKQQEECMSVQKTADTSNISSLPQVKDGQKIIEGRPCKNHSEETVQESTESDKQAVQSSTVTSNSKSSQESKSNARSKKINKKKPVNKQEKLTAKKLVSNDNSNSSHKSSSNVNSSSLNVNSASSNVSSTSPNVDSISSNVNLTSSNVNPTNPNVNSSSSNANLEKIDKKEKSILKKKELTAEELAKIGKLKNERDSLQKNVICNVCNERKIELLFLPCRHMVACDLCGRSVNNCGKCSKSIVATVRIYLP